MRIKFGLRSNKLEFRVTHVDNSGDKLQFSEFSGCIESGEPLELTIAFWIGKVEVYLRKSGSDPFFLKVTNFDSSKRKYEDHMIWLCNAYRGEDPLYHIKENWEQYF